ncbi:hypothetical protein RHSIM_Rhsim06G0144800 [Rhododendron simsii]|uniref:PGG domain-containing protein n=1 Tax=Rhododendron simsii TaxID=118357 RepID=A0A834GYF9_RHOSS|nr:hypothetical protein RHSIM_Rhsim06G0144800 [Rhododendron simsii]
MLNTIPRFIQLRDEDGETPLHCAASKGYYEGVQYLLDKSSECELERDDNGFLIASCLVQPNERSSSLIWAQLGDLNLILASLRLALPLLRLALSMMFLAFKAGVYLVVSKLTWLANVVLIMVIVFLSILLVIFIPLFFPYTTTFPVIRHISYHFFCLMMLASGSSREAEEE